MKRMGAFHSPLWRQEDQLQGCYCCLYKMMVTRIACWQKRWREMDGDERYLAESTGLGLWLDVGGEIDVVCGRKRDRERQKKIETERYESFRLGDSIPRVREQKRWSRVTVKSSDLMCSLRCLSMMEHRCWVGCGLCGFCVRRTVRARDVDFGVISMWVVTGITWGDSSERCQERRAGCPGLHSGNISNKE